MSEGNILLDTRFGFCCFSTSWPHEVNYLCWLEMWGGPALGARDWYPRQVMHLVLLTIKGESEMRFWCLKCYLVSLYQNC